MTSESDSGSIRYASVSCGSTVLADILPAGDALFAGAGGAGELSALATSCLDAAPPFHVLYTHTAGGLIYAFLMAEPLVLFAIADESLGRSAVLLFLHRLRDATVLVACRRIDASDPVFERCLQEQLLPVIRRLVAGFSVSASDEEKPSQSSPTAISYTPLASTTPSSDSLLLTGEHKRKVKKECRKNQRREEGVGDSRSGDEHEISVTDNDGDGDLGLGLGGRKSMQRIWRQQVRMVLIIDLVVCSLLFGIWLSVCKGFQCVGV